MYFLIWQKRMGEWWVCVNKNAISIMSLCAPFTRHNSQVTRQNSQVVCLLCVHHSIPYLYYVLIVKCQQRVHDRIHLISLKIIKKYNNNISRQLHQPQNESRNNETHFNDDARFVQLHQSTSGQRYSTK